MKVIIVSIDHTLQLAEGWADTETMRLRKLELRRLLLGIFEKNKICMIFEESARDRRTIALELAEDHDPKIPWKNIVMTPEERRAAGIFEALQARPSRPDFDDMSTIESRIPEDEVREEFFAEEIKQSKGLDGVALALLGDMHVGAVADRLSQGEFDVTICSEMITKKQWE